MLTGTLGDTPSALGFFVLGYAPVTVMPTPAVIGTGGGWAIRPKPHRKPEARRPDSDIIAVLLAALLDEDWP